MTTKREVEKYIADLDLKAQVAMRDQLNVSIAEAQETSKGEFIKKMQEEAKALGLNFAEFARGPRTKVARFRDPATGQTWSGLGRIPSWAKKAKDAGHLDQYQIGEDHSDEDEAAA